MHETVSLLSLWQNFYVILGTAAATLIGLMFVAITLAAGLEARRPAMEKGIAAFNTPGIIHFCTALLVAALFNAPWQALWPLSLLLGLCGLAGMSYVLLVLRRVRRQDYRLVMEDWIWHTVFPLLSYTVLLVSAILLTSTPFPALFLIGAAIVLLLFIGIHNAWDNMTYLVLQRTQPGQEKVGEPGS